MNLPPYADACQSLACFPGDFPAVTPHRVSPPVNGSVLAEYRHDCGYEWTCWWNPAVSAWPGPLDHPPAALPAAA